MMLALFSSIPRRGLQLAAALMLVLATAGAQAQELRIAAVVNDDIISVVDLTKRIRLVLASSGLEDSPQSRQRVAQQVLRALVDEKLQMQEATRLNVKVGDDEIGDAMARIEQQNKIPRGGLDQLLKSRGIDRDSLVKQLSASIAWGKLVRRKLGLSVQVSDDAVDEQLARLRESIGQPQVRVGEIFLSVDDPKQEDEVRRFAEKLTEQLRDGAAFSALAQQFSQSPTAAVGGDIGWVTTAQLSPEIRATVERLKQNEMSPPVRSGSGYYVVMLIDRRAAVSLSPDDTIVQLSQVVFPLAQGASDADRRKAQGDAEQVATTARSCGEMARIGQERAPQTSGDLGRVRVGDLGPDIKNAVLALPIAQPSKPLPLRGGIGVLMVCAREDGAGALPSRDDVAESLTRARLENLARRYLRDLRRAAFVDVRV